MRYKKVVYFFALLAFYLPINESKVKAAEVIPVATTSDLLTPPHTNKPIQVAVGFYLIDFDTFNEQDESFKLDGYLFLTWQDQRLAVKSNSSGLNQKNYKFGEIWTPNLNFFNVQFNRDIAYRQLQVKADGTVLYKERFTAEFDSEMNLQKFPFDSQKLKLILEAVDNADNINLLVDKSKTGISSDAFFTGWRIGEDSAGIRNRKSEVEANEVHQEYVYEINIFRSYNSYVWNIVLPLLFIIGVSWAVFWSKSFESNAVISFSSLLSAIAFNIVIAEALPKVAYGTFINGFILLIYIFICLSIVQIVIKHCLELEKKREEADKLDLASRWIFPTTFGVANLFLILIFLV